MSTQENRQSNFSMMVLLLIPVSIAINIVGGQLSAQLKLPLDLDMIGTILVGALAGPIPAAVTGVLSNLLNGIFAPAYIPYAVVAMFIGIAAGLLAKYNMMNNWWKIIVSGLIIALVATITATPVTVFLFGGVTGGGASMITAGLLATGAKIVNAVFSVYIVTESIGKVISIVVAYMIIRAIPARTLVKYRFGMNYAISKSGKA